MSAVTRNPLIERALRILPAILYLAFTWLASAQTADAFPPIVSDKIAHVGEYGLLALLLVFAFTGFDAEKVGAVPLLAVFVLSVGWGILDEYHQSFVATREASFLDLVADGAGAGAAVSLVAFLAWGERRRA